MSEGFIRLGRGQILWDEIAPWTDQDAARVNGMLRAAAGPITVKAMCLEYNDTNLYRVYEGGRWAEALGLPWASFDTLATGLAGPPA